MRLLAHDFARELMSYYFAWELLIPELLIPMLRPQPFFPWESVLDMYGKAMKWYFSQREKPFMAFDMIDGLGALDLQDISVVNLRRIHVASSFHYRLFLNLMGTFVGCT